LHQERKELPGQKLFAGAGKEENLKNEVGFEALTLAELAFEAPLICTFPFLTETAYLNLHALSKFQLWGSLNGQKHKS
jgi:hypothetical protein